MAVCVCVRFCYWPTAPPDDPSDGQLQGGKHRPAVGRDHLHADGRRRGAHLHVDAGDGRRHARPHLRRLVALQRRHLRSNDLLLERRARRQKVQGPSQEGMRCAIGNPSPQRDEETKVLASPYRS